MTIIILPVFKLLTSILFLLSIEVRYSPLDKSVQNGIDIGVFFGRYANAIIWMEVKEALKLLFHSTNVSMRQVDLVNNGNNCLFRLKSEPKIRNSLSLDPLTCCYLLTDKLTCYLQINIFQHILDWLLPKEEFRRKRLKIATPHRKNPHVPECRLS